jgi:hypothetical protein
MEGIVTAPKRPSENIVRASRQLALAQLRYAPEFEIELIKLQAKFSKEPPNPKARTEFRERSRVIQDDIDAARRAALEALHEHRRRSSFKMLGSARAQAFRDARRNYEPPTVAAPRS